MLNNIFFIPYEILSAISEGSSVVYSSIYDLWLFLFDSPVGPLFFVAISITVIFVVIKFIRSLVWGA